MTTPDPKAQRLTRARDRMRIEQSLWVPQWRDCASFCCPQKQKAVDYSYATLTQQTRPWFNPFRESSTAIDALNTMAGGLKTYLIPGGDEGWGGAWEPDPAISTSTVVKDWLADCTSRSISPLQRGGFFTAGHELFQDLGVFGTEGFLIEEGDDQNPIYCQAIMPMNFVFQRDWTGLVMEVHITWSKTAKEIKDKFSAPGDQVPEAVLRDCNGESGDNVHEFMQSIYRRSEAEMGETREHEPQGQRFASCWVHISSMTIMRERGYPEMPFMAPRWNSWAGTGPSNYGTSPAMQALADCKGLNLLDMVMATRAEIEINPRVKVMPDQTSAVDLSPGGITLVNSAQSVTEWAVAGSYPVGKDQNDVITKRINRAFFTDLFEAITPIAQQRELNIPVAQMIQRESASRITPAMGRIEQEFFNPALERAFYVLLRAGVFEAPPEEAFHFDAADRPHFIAPRIVQANRWTRTINARKSQAFSQAMGRAIQIAQVKPEILDLYKFEDIARDLDRGDGMPGEWVRTEQEIAELQAARAKASQEQAVQQTLLDAAGKQPMQVAQIATGNIKAA